MRAYLVFLLAVALSQTAAAATWNIVLMGQRRYVPVSDVAAFYHMKESVSDASSFRLTAANRIVDGKAGTSDVRVNGVKYVTCFPLRTRGDRVYISAMDVSKIIEPVMRPGKIKGAKPIHTIVLDAGHGGHDSGAVGAYGREKDYALDVALRARALLLKAGYQVKMTRATDVFIPLEERADFANHFPDALFMSVHFNKSNTYGGTGIETYALAPRGVPSMDEASLRYSDFNLNPGNAHDAENIALAAAVHSAMCRRLPVPDRGVKRARFAVIRRIRIPGVLIEGGFVDSSYDARLIATAEYRQRIAQSILAAVTAYTRSVTGTQASSVVTAVPTPTPDASLDEILGDKPPPIALAPEKPSETPAPPTGNPAWMPKIFRSSVQEQLGSWRLQPVAASVFVEITTPGPALGPAAASAEPTPGKTMRARPNRDFPR